MLLVTLINLSLAVGVLALTLLVFTFYHSDKVRGRYLDRIYGKVFTTRCFTKGWGKPEDFKRLLEFWKLVTKREICNHLVPDNHPVSITKEEIQSNYRILDGQFVSPFVDHMPGLLPRESEIAYFQVILPKMWRDEQYKPVCLHLAGTGDHGYFKRKFMFAQPLLDTAGIGAILLENPFYGLRKPKDQVGCNLNHVTDLFAMAACLVLECLVLLHWCERQGFGPLGLSGMSMGGHMASFAAASWPKPVALIPCLSGSSAAPIFTEGVMSDLINWQLLEKQYIANEEQWKDIRKHFKRGESAGHRTQSQPLFESSKNKNRLKLEALHLMREIMDECTDLVRFEMPIDAQLVKAVCATDDAYVPNGAFTSWNELWAGAEVVEVNAGHVSSYFLHREAFRKAIVECFDCMKEKYCSRS